MIKMVYKELLDSIRIAKKYYASERAVHSTMFKLAAALLAFLATGYLSYLFALVPMEQKIKSELIIAQSEVRFYQQSDDHSAKDEALAEGKLEAANKSMEVLSSAVGLLYAVATLILTLAPLLLLFGFMHWWKYVINLELGKTE